MMFRKQSDLKRKRFFAICATMSMTLLMILVTACGYNSSNTGSSGPTPTSTPPLQVQNCGSLHTIHLLIVPADQNIAKQAEDCFWQAFQQCHPAKLSYTQSELDTGTIHNFSLKNVNGTCTISDEVQHFLAPKPPQVVATYTCGDLKQTSGGLQFVSCGSLGDVLIPTGST